MGDFLKGRLHLKKEKSSRVPRFHSMAKELRPNLRIRARNQKNGLTVHENTKKGSTATNGRCQSVTGARAREGEPTIGRHSIYQRKKREPPMLKLARLETLRPCTSEFRRGAHFCLVANSESGKVEGKQRAQAMSSKGSMEKGDARKFHLC